MLSITNYQGNASQNNESTSYLSAWLSSERTQQIFGEDVEKRKPLYIADGCKLAQPLRKTAWRFLKKLKINVTNNTALGYISEKNKNANSKKYMYPDVHHSTVYNS